MEAYEEDSGGNAPPPTFGRTLQDDTAEYMLFMLDDSQEETAASPSKPLAKLDQLRKSALHLSDKLTKGYIWQRDRFDVEVVSRNGLLYLRGLTSYGDCVEDEWLIVYMLRELTKSFPGAWARICDSDGEFLLVEAAKSVPKWLNPEIDANRVWIHGGLLKIIPVEAKQIAGPKPAGSSERPSITLAEAVQIIKTTPNALLHLPTLDNEAFYRLQKYPGHVVASIHHARLILPRKIAYILHDRPQVVAPAVEAFTSRDPLTTRRIFDPEQLKIGLQFYPTDLVIVSVKFTKVLFAQLRGQRFTPPKEWPDLFAARAKAVWQPKTGKLKRKDEVEDGDKLDVMVELSMKLTCGFEMMVLAAEKNNSRIVREVGIFLEDLADDGNDPIALPSNEEIRAWKNANRDDDDSWLNIDFKTFEGELDDGHQKQGGVFPLAREAAAEETDSSPSAVPNSGFGDAGVQTDLRKIVSRFQAFLNDNDAGIDGTEYDEMDGDDDSDGDDDNSEGEGDDINFNEEEFSSLMREMMGLPLAEAVATKASAATRQGHESTSAAISHNLVGGSGGIMDEENILKLAAQFEAELKGHGALRLNPLKNGKETASAAKNITADVETGNRTSAAGSESDGEGEVDVDFNLAKNLLESFKGQEGMSGPAGNILGMLGLVLPRDDDDDEEEK